MGARERAYNASIELMAIFPIGDSFAAEDFSELVRQAGTLTPWQDRLDLAPTEIRLCWMTSVTVAEGEWIDRRYQLEIQSPHLLAFSQLHAFEQYGKGLARQVAATIPARCLRVDSRLIATGTFGEGFRPSVLQRPIGQIR